MLKRITRESPVVVLSDEAGSSKKIEGFTTGDKRWMVAVRMVSEGVDIPRLAVGVYATTTATPLFFAQAVGRFVRARGRGETASIFLPSVPSLLGYAAELEVARDHVLGRRINDEADIFAAENELLARAQAGEGALEEGLPFEALGSEARFDHVLFDGATFGHEGDVHVGSDEEMDFLGIPGLLEPGPDARAPPAAAGQAAAYGRSRSRTRSPSSPPTSSWPRCAASSTVWSPPGTTAPARRTASPTPSCAASAAARRPRSPTPPSSGPGSTGSGSGRRPASQLRSGPRTGFAPEPGCGMTSRWSSTTWPSSQVSTGRTRAPQSRCVISTAGPSGSARYCAPHSASAVSTG